MTRTLKISTKLNMIWFFAKPSTKT